VLGEHAKRDSRAASHVRERSSPTAARAGNTVCGRTNGGNREEATENAQPPLLPLERLADQRLWIAERSLGSTT
jgi:hypothetical protein